MKAAFIERKWQPMLKSGSPIARIDKIPKEKKIKVFRNQSAQPIIPIQQYHTFVSKRRCKSPEVQ